MSDAQNSVLCFQFNRTKDGFQLYNLLWSLWNYTAVQIYSHFYIPKLDQKHTCGYNSVSSIKFNTNNDIMLFYLRFRL